MCRRLEKTFFQGKQVDGQQAHEKMLNITNHQRNANQNRMSYHLTPVRLAMIKKNTNNNGKNVEKREPSYTVGRNANCGKPHGDSSKKKKIECSFDVLKWHRKLE